MKKFDLIYENLLEIGGVEDQYRYSIDFLGKCPSYYSALKAKGRTPTIDVLCHLAINLQYLSKSSMEAAESELPEDRNAYLRGAVMLNEFTTEIWAEIYFRVLGSEYVKN